MPFTNRPYESDGNYANGRRAVRSLTELKRVPRNGTGNSRMSKPAPPEATNAESFYYVKQMSSKTPMVIVMTDGEQIRGRIEWYDRNSIKVNREVDPKLLIQKHWIKYLFKEDEIAE